MSVGGVKEERRRRQKVRRYERARERERESAELFKCYSRVSSCYADVVPCVSWITITGNALAFFSLEREPSAMSIVPLLDCLDSGGLHASFHHASYHASHINQCPIHATATMMTPTAITIFDFISH